MSMNIALTGLFAANTDLATTSDNIANAGTTGFKTARAEFGDLVNTMSIQREGMGVRLQKITQTFSQGSIENTGNTFDMAIAGEGFFRVDTGNQIVYTRAGSFRPDADGNIINNLGQNLTGYTVIESTPQATTEMQFDLIFNKDATRPGDAVIGNGATTGDGVVAGTAYSFSAVRLNPNAAIGETYATTGGTFTKTAANAWSLLTPNGGPAVNVTFDATTGALTAPVAPATGSTVGVPATSPDNFYNLTGLTESPIFLPEDPTTYNYSTSLKVFDTLGLDHNLKTYFRNTDNPTSDTWEVYHVLDNLPPIKGDNLVFTATTAGSTVATGGSQSIAFTEAQLGTGVGSALLAVDLDFSDIVLGSSFSTITLSANGAEGGERTISPLLGNLRIESDSMIPRRTSEVGLGLNLSAIEQEARPSTSVIYDLNLSSTATAPTVTTFDAANSLSYNYSTTMQVYDAKGSNHTLQTYFVYTGTPNEWQIYHKLDDKPSTPPTTGTPSVPAGAANTWTIDPTASPINAAANAIQSVTFTTAELGTGALPLTVDLDYSSIKQGVTNVINNLQATNPSADPATIDASNPANYQYASSLTVFDTLGVDHTLNLYFRKIADNNWSIYQNFEGIGGTNAERVGTILFDSLGLPLRAIDNTGTTNSQNQFSLNILGIYFGGGAGRQNIELNFADSTQFDSASIINSLAQNGYTMGQLVGVEPDSTGTIVARYSNNQTQAMGQVALANFANIQGLKRVGDNNWIASTESGLEKVGKPSSGMLGQVVAGSLEGSNTDMTKELVNMITAQRNFQANTQVVSTYNTLTQALFNIR